MEANVRNEVDLYSQAKTISSEILISGAPNSTPSIDSAEIDTIDADAHETFTLEEMKRLILSYRNKNKDFLIARVTTPDPEDQTIFYNFYYAAAEINRILFRFESERRLLHRMKVKNPLNNMYIVGQVFYYKLTSHDIDSAIVDYFFNSEKEQKRLRRSFSAIFSTSTQNVVENKMPDKRSRDCSDIKHTQENYKNKISNDNDNKCKKHLENKGPREIIDSIRRGLIKVPSDVPSDRKIQYSAKFFATDDDFLLKSEVREYFRKNALEENDEFLYEIDRTRNDFMALIDDESEDGTEDISDWRRIFSAHISLALSMLFLCLLLGGGPIIALILLPLAAVLFLSFLCSLTYVLCCRRSTFDSIAVNSVEDEI